MCAVLCSLKLMQERLTEGLWTLNIAPCPSFWHNWTGWRCLLGDISQWKSKYSILNPCFQFGGTWFELGSCLLRWVSGRVSLRTEVSESFLYTHKKHTHIYTLTLSFVSVFRDFWIQDGCGYSLVCCLIVHLIHSVCQDFIHPHDIPNLLDLLFLEHKGSYRMFLSTKSMQQHLTPPHISGLEQHIRVNKWWMNIHFGMNNPLKHCVKNIKEKRKQFLFKMFALQYII